MVDATATDRDGSAPVARPAAEILVTIRVTCRRLYAVEDDFVESFRRSLAQLVPELQHTTPDHGSSIAEGLARAVLWAGLTEDPPDVVEVTFRNVGAEYGRRGFPDSGYHGAGHALLRAVRDTQLAEWTSELSSAWVAFYSWLAVHLAAGAPQQVDAPQRLGTPQQLGAPQQLDAPQQVDAPQQLDDARPGPPITPALLRTPVVTDPPAAPPHAGRSNGPGSLDEILDLLQTRHFAGNERSLGAVLTRVALRTGADLRAPRPDQRTNPAVISNVIAVLQVMGYVLQPGGSEAVQRVISPPRPDATPGRWWQRRRSTLNRSLPGTFR